MKTNNYNNTEVTDIRSVPCPFVFLHAVHLTSHVRPSRLYIRPHELLQRLANATKTEASNPTQRAHNAKVTPLSTVTSHLGTVYLFPGIQ